MDEIELRNFSSKYMIVDEVFNDVAVCEGS